MSKISILCLVAVFAFASSAFSDIPKIGIVQITDLKLYNETVDGFKDGMKELGYRKDVNYKLIRRVVLGDTKGLWNKLKLKKGLEKYVQEFIDERADVIVTIGTPATSRSSSMIKAARIPQIFAAVSDPFAVKCKSMRHCLPGLTGASIYVDPKKGLAVVKKIAPNVRKIGTLFSDDENAIAYKDRLITAARKMGIEVVAVKVKTNSDARPAAESVINAHVDAFLGIPDVWLGRDNFVNARTLLDTISIAKLPVVVMVGGSAEYGALIALGPSFRTSGKEASRFVDKILKKQISQLDAVEIYYQEQLPYEVNVKALRGTKIQIPYDILKFARKVGQ